MMKKNKQNEEKQAGHRLHEAVDGPMIRVLYSKMPTKEVAQRLGLTVKQIKNFVYKRNTKPWARKLHSLLSAENSEKGKKGGRPKKNEK